MIFRKFGEELNAFLGRHVVVVTGEGKEYTGQLVGVDEKLNIVGGRFIEKGKE